MSVRGSALIGVIGLLLTVSLVLSACVSVKPIVKFRSSLTLLPSETRLKSGQTFQLTVALTYRDATGTTWPIPNQPVTLEGVELTLAATTVITDQNGEARVEGRAPDLPQREERREGWVRAYFGGALVEFIEEFRRFSDARNDRFFVIIQPAVGLNP